MIAEVVMKNVECDILLHEVSMVERQFRESTKKKEWKLRSWASLSISKDENSL